MSGNSRVRGSSAILCAWLLSHASVFSATDGPAVTACDRELRKTFEAIQAWRRTHGGRYPDRIADLGRQGVGICPAYRAELANASPSHGLSTSRREGGDPAGTYEYELSSILKSKEWAPWLPSNSPAFTRGEFKVQLLQREHWEQVPILRCFTHRAEAPSRLSRERNVARNFTASGDTYWSGEDWELEWLETVPYCCRQANVMFGLKGPPFYSGRAPALANALDLRAWNCAFGDHAWWWTFPLFEQGEKRQQTPQLRPLFQEQHGRAVSFGGTKWWLDGLVQLQGRVVKGDLFRAPGMQAFVWERKGVRIGRPVREATWLQGTVWTARTNEVAGELVWHYSDEGIERVPIVYGKNTARFWGDADQARREQNFPEPIWKHHESAETVGKKRWLRIYQQTWSNPRPNVVVESVDFVSNTNCTAAPFLIAINALP